MMVSGRLREHNREKIAEDLIKWATKEDSINLNGFCATKLIAPSKLSLWSKEDEFFRQAFEIAKSFIGERRERLLTNDMLHVKAYDLNAAVYDRFLKEERMEMAKYETLLKFVQEENQNPEVIDKFNSLMDLMKQNQERKIEEINSKAEVKS
jgi:hypothetical protein